MRRKRLKELEKRLKERRNALKKSKINKQRPLLLLSVKRSKKNARSLLLLHK
jgi:hypothetical protein